MATKPANLAMPEGFKSPFTRVEMEERLDDSLACVATLTGRSLADVNALAVQLGVPPYGPYFIDGDMIAKLLINLGGLVATKYQEFTSWAALPDVAILLVDYDENTEVGRHVVWHHVRATKELQSFGYVIDLGHWIDATDHVTRNFEHFEPAYFIGVNKPGTGGKAK